MMARSVALTEWTFSANRLPWGRLPRMSGDRRGPKAGRSKRGADGGARSGRSGSNRSSGGSGERGRGSRGSDDGRGPKQRRALTGARGGGRISCGGEPRFAAGLAAALEAPVLDEDHSVAESFTHNFHAYPARMHPAIARAIIEGLTPKRLVDPFCGSGTTLVEAIRAKASAHGIDANPLAVQLATIKTWTPGRPAVRQLSVLGREIADISMQRVKEARRSKAAKAADKTSRPRTRKGLAGWFAPHVLAELETLFALIREHGDSDPNLPLRKHFEMVLSSFLYKVSFRASDTDSSVISRQVPRGAVSRHFRERVIALSDSLRGIARCEAPVPTIELGDARELDLETDSVDLVLTSPPYPGTYDYVSHHQLRMNFLEIETATFNERELGARRHFRGQGGSTASIDTWRADSIVIMKSLKRSLSGEGHICLLVGDSLAGGYPVRADEETARIAEAAGLEVVAWAWQTRRSLGGREREVFADTPKREHLILLK